MKETLKFKTTINCGGCVSRVTPFLNKLEGIAKWEVNTDSPEKVLTVETNGANEQDIINTVKKLGFEIEKI